MHYIYDVLCYSLHLIKDFTKLNYSYTNNRNSLRRFKQNDAIYMQVNVMLSIQTCLVKIKTLKIELEK